MRRKEVVHAHALAYAYWHPAIRQNGRPLRVPQQSARWPGVAGASGAVARSTAALWLRHVTTWSMTRCPGHPRLGELPLLKGHGSTPLLRSLINVGHRQQAVFPPTRTSQWLFGDWGRAGRGAGEPGPASGAQAASLAGPPPGPRGPR